MTTKYEIEVSYKVKQEIERRRRGDETYDQVLQRILDVDVPPHPK